MLKLGSIGNEVEWLKKALKEAGVEVTESDIFDRETQLAVKAFQSKHVDNFYNPLTPDGIVGPLTKWALEEYYKYEQPSSNIIIEQVGNLSQIALKIAKNEMEIGAREIGGDNSGPFVEKYTKVKNGGKLDWCAGFVSYCFEQASIETGIKYPLKYTLGARNIFNQAKRKNLTITDRNILPIPGDILVWYRGALKGYFGHVGICSSYSDGYVSVIEGNRGKYPAKVNIFQYVWNRMDKFIGLVRINDNITRKIKC